MNPPLLIFAFGMCVGVVALTVNLIPRLVACPWWFENAADFTARYALRVLPFLAGLLVFGLLAGWW